MSVSKVYADFVSTPMLNNSIRALPGIGPVYEQSLKQNGIFCAEQLLVQLLVLKNQKEFVNWLGISPHCGKQVHDALLEWRRRFIG
ncbi:unnamed protein product [Clavelina lepadiformis]|uniref:Uncharacterized protein n=1 Tax=Clavelina lepadiformis TaxID=159417 RepID=A0ABP0FRP6_CLALP